jgi:hypothetical protein
MVPGDIEIGGESGGEVSKWIGCRICTLQMSKPGSWGAVISNIPTCVSFHSSIRHGMVTPVDRNASEFKKMNWRGCTWPFSPNPLDLNSP